MQFEWGYKVKVLLAHKFLRVTGGAEVFYFEVARVLEQNGHEVAFFSTAHAENEQVDRGYFVDEPQYKSSNIITKTKGLAGIFYSGEKKQAMIDAIDDFKPDVLHVFAIHVHLTPSILEAAKECGVPVLMSCNDYKHICPNYKLYDGNSLCESCKGGRFYNTLIKKCCHNSLAYSAASMLEAYIHEHKGVYDKYVDKYLFASEFMLSKTKEFWTGRQVNYGMLRNPFDASDYSVSNGGEYALYFGRVIDEKGIDLLVEEASAIDVPLKVIGDGPDLQRLTSQVAALGIENIEFLGAKWGEALKKELSNAAFVVVPSLWHENFPYVIFQSFAAGKPVLGSNRGGIPELIGEDRGFVFDVEVKGDLARKMELLMSDTEGAIRMGQTARCYVEAQYNDSAFYETLIGHYKDVL